MKGARAKSIWPDNAPFALTICWDGPIAGQDLLEDLGGVSISFFPNPTQVLDDVTAWRSLAEIGHEIGSNSLLGVADHGSLLNWPLAAVEHDLRMSVRLLNELIGVHATSFALPGWSTACMDGDYHDLAARLFRFVRGMKRAPNATGTYDLSDLASYPVSFTPDEVEPKDGWVIVRAGPNPDEWLELVRWLKWAQAAEAWIAPLSVVGDKLDSSFGRGTVN